MKEIEIIENDVEKLETEYNNEGNELSH